MQVQYQNTSLQQGEHPQRVPRAPREGLFNLLLSEVVEIGKTALFVLRSLIIGVADVVWGTLIVTLESIPDTSGEYPLVIPTSPEQRQYPTGQLIPQITLHLPSPPEWMQDVEARQAFNDYATLSIDMDLEISSTGSLPPLTYVRRQLRLMHTLYNKELPENHDLLTRVSQAFSNILELMDSPARSQHIVQYVQSHYASLQTPLQAPPRANGQIGIDHTPHYAVLFFVGAGTGLVAYKLTR